MAFTLVTVTGTYHEAPGGSPASGQVVFQLQQTLSQPGEILEPQALSATLDASGHISVQLVATDDPTTQPQGTTWLVTEEIQGEVPRNYSIAVPHTAGSLDLATVAPVIPQAATFSYVLSSAVGAPNGVASLDGSGLVPASQLGHARVPVRGSFTGTGAQSTFTVTHGLGLSAPFTCMVQFFVDTTGTDDMVVPMIGTRTADSFVATFPQAPASGVVIDWIVSG